MAPSWLELEVTEHDVMKEPDRAIEVLTRLNGMGIRLCIDDFGIGHSSLGLLQRLPVKIVKIDTSRIIGMASKPADAVMVRSIIELAHNLGLQVVAEGVEHQAIWDQLVTFGCDAAQGYYISKPMPEDELTQWLAGAPSSRSRNVKKQ
jgi:EAL domain-containing protein (putative c-di-GMP-specific phosphodiesterase class I)